MFRSVSVFFLVALGVVSTLYKEHDDIWEEFKSVHQKQYHNEEEVYRRLVFEENVAKINQHNLQQDLGIHTYRLGLNKFSDWTTKEFASHLKSVVARNNRTSKAMLTSEIADLPDTVDWRTQGVVGPVQDQGQCGSPWVFSAVGTLEGIWALAHGGRKAFVLLSEQNLIDCAGGGCQGGDVTLAFDYIKKNGGIDRQDCYPTTAREGPCAFNSSCVGATLSGYVDIASDEAALQTAVANVGPVAVAVDASNFSFQLYSGGLYDEPNCSSTLLDHQMLVVGYGTQDGQAYWLVKNSWGVNWGEAGYIKMSRNKNNQCGIASAAIYPNV